MLNLFLSPPDHLEDDAQSQRRIRLLERVEPIIWETLSADGPFEVHLWLCSSLGSIDSIPRRDQSALFLDILRSKHEKGNGRKVATQLLRMLCESVPEKAGKIFAKKSRLFQKFFRGNSKRILQWFDHFAGYGACEHKRGARSISQFAFVNRDLCWDELEWKGRHGQSPAMVATKPHYFQDLDVLSTVENLLENVTQFWSSEEFASSVQDGEILSLDREFFLQELHDMMFEDDCLEVWQAVEEFLLQEKFSNLCQRLLIHLGDRELLAFLNAVGKILAHRKHDDGFDSQDEGALKLFQFNWLETVMSVGIEFKSIGELLLSNACINYGRQTLRLLCDEEHEERTKDFDKIVLEMNQSSKDSDHWAVKRECLSMPKMVAIKLLAIESCVLHYRLSNECKSATSCESLFTSNGIEFRYPGISLMVCNDLSSKEKNFRSSRGSKKRKRKDKARKRKRNKFSGAYSGSSSDEDMDKDYSKWSDPEERKWQLSTDNYNSNWNKVDLPEHLARYAFLGWLKWLIKGWNEQS